MTRSLRWCTSAFSALIAGTLVITLASCGGSDTPTTAPNSASASTERESSDSSALPVLIESENAAVYAYGVIGAHLRGAQRARSVIALEAHRRLRDAWIAAATTAQQEIPPAAIAYDLPIQVRTPADAQRLATWIEERMLSVYESAGPIAAKAAERALQRQRMATP